MYKWIFFFPPACCSSNIPRLPLHCPLELQTCKAAFSWLDPAQCFVFLSKKQPLEHLSTFPLPGELFRVLKKKNLQFLEFLLPRGGSFLCCWSPSTS